MEGLILLVVMMVGGFVCMIIAALIGLGGGSGTGTAGPIDIMEPIDKYPPLSSNNTECREPPAKKTDSHFMEKVTYVGAMHEIWKDQN